jgi:chromosome segregation ATPase
MKKPEKKKKPTRIRKHQPARSADIPVTKAMLDEAREELKHQITSVKLELNAKIEALDAKIGTVDSKIGTMDSKIEIVLAAVHRVGLLVEEQNARNKFVLDGYTSLNDRLEKLERRDEDKGY